jgi:hypothetical protein
MMKDKSLQETGTNEKKKSWIFYLNDDGNSVNAFVEVIEIGSFVIFKTEDNLIKLPSGRVLKIKERL